MVLRIRELRLRPDHTGQELAQEIRKLLRLPDKEKLNYEIVRQSVDARKKPDLKYVYTVDVTVDHPRQVMKRIRNGKVTLEQKREYVFPYDRSVRGSNAGQTLSPPVVVGSGPAGLFCALMLARAGLRPIVLERGEPVGQRMQTVRRFWEGGQLNPESNVQFGEGGAGTFSDGKLNTLIRDPDGRIRFVLREFVRAGAPEEILYQHKPHIGTDVLAGIVRTIREEILSLGGEFLFSSCLTGIAVEKPGGAAAAGSGRQAYVLSLNRGERTLRTQQLVLAIGHSARDTLSMLCEFGLPMQAKAFAVGLRVEHSQKTINDAMFGPDCPYEMGAAPYKLTHKCGDGRGVYSFCMCPGGYVVNASSEPGRTAVNGMSYSARDGANANSAIVVTVTPEDYQKWISEDPQPERQEETRREGQPLDPAEHPLSGVAFQRKFDQSQNPAAHPLSGVAFQRRLEEAAYECGGGKIPVQRFADFCENVPTEEFGTIRPQCKGAFAPSNLRGILPERLNECIIEGIQSFGEKIAGFDAPDALLSGVESRTSSPVRILRDDSCQSIFPGIYPCGEGAGYAGGITSAAVDGIRVAEHICGVLSEGRG